MEPVIQVVVVADSDRVGERLLEALGVCPGLEVVGAVAEIDDALSRLDAGRPDAILISSDTPDSGATPRPSATAEGEGYQARASTLTVREREVLELLAEGLSNREIATRLSIEVATVKNHVHHILEKLHVDRRAKAVAWTSQHGPARSNDVKSRPPFSPPGEARRKR